MSASSHIKEPENRPSDAVLAKMPPLSPGAAAIIHAHLPPPNVEQYLAQATPELPKLDQESTQGKSNRVDATIKSPKPRKVHRRTTL
jgi:hypothetical protein